MLRAGFFPTSFITIKTVVTFRALEDQRLDNLECKSALLKYWNKLKRKTSSHLWLSIPVRNSANSDLDIGINVLPEQNRYREFLRVSRMWRNIQNIIQFGFGHDSGASMGKGSLAMFCPTCPQPGINLPDGWENDPEQ
jgi:hypothetical protein